MASPILQFKRGNFGNLPGLQAGEPALTLDKFDLYVGIDSTTGANKLIGSHRYWTRETTTAGSGVNLVEGTNNGSNKLTLKAPATIGSDQVYTLPAAATNNGFLKSDGSGNLTWDTNPGSSGNSAISTLDIDGGTDIGADIVDADLIIVDDGAGGTNRKSAASRVKKYIWSSASGDATASDSGAITLADSGVTAATVGSSTAIPIITVDAKGRITNTSTTAIDQTTIAQANTNIAVSDSGTGTAVVTIDGSTHSTFAAAGLTLATGSFNGSVAGATAGTLPLAAVDIDGGTATTTVADADLMVIDDGANGTNRKVTASVLKDYFLGGGAGANFNSINVTGISTVSQADASTLKVSGISTFTGNVNVSGVFAANGNVDLGNATSDTITPTGRFDGDIVPSTDNAVDLGASGLEFKDLYIDGTANIDAASIDSATLASAKVSDLTSGRVVLAGTAGEIEDSGNLTFNGTTLTVTGAAAIDNVSIDANTVTTSSGNLTIDSAGGTTTIADNTIISGNLTVNGTTNTVNSTTVTIADKNFQVATGAADDAAANGAGLTVDSGDGDKTWNFEATGDNWGSSENINLASGKVLKINNSAVLSASALNIGGGTVTAGDVRNSDGGVIAQVGAIQASGHAGLVTAFKFTGTGLDSFSVASGVAQIALTGVAGTTFTTSQTVTATQGQTAFTFSAGYTNGFMDCYLNGSRLITGTDYVQTNANTVTLASGATVGDELEMVAFKSLGNVVSVGSLQTTSDLTVTGVTTATGGVIGNLTGNVTGNASGNAGTATALQNARTIGGVSFDGTANINLPGVNASGTQDTSGNAATATVGTTITVADESSDTTCFPLFATAASGNLGAKSGTNLTFNSSSGALSATSFSGSGSGLTAGTTPITTLDIDGGTATTTLADADLFIVDDGAGGTNRKVTFETISDAVLGGSGGATFAAVNVTGITTVGGIIDGNGGANISGGAGLVASTAKISDLTDNRVVIAGTSGELEDSGNLTFNGSTLAVTGNITSNSGATLTGGETTLSSATVSDLTDNRVVIAGSAGALEDSNNLTFDGSTLAVTGAATVSSNLTVSGNLTVNGTTSSVNTVNTTIEDTLLDLQVVDGGALSADTNKDVGIVMNYYSGSAKKAAFYWDDSAGRFVVSAVATESAGVLTNSTAGGFEIGSLYLNDCAGTSQVISCSGTTRSLDNITIDGGTF
tara:strand:- start:2314 stop:5910 length:3597 start_codon:yes stop_codon:yes gene_type:complete